MREKVLCHLIKDGYLALFCHKTILDQTAKYTVLDFISRVIYKYKY